MAQPVKDLAFYKRLPYTLRIEEVLEAEKEPCWIAEYVELRGCKTDGATEADAVANLQELFDEYVTAKIEDGISIPEPESLPPVNPSITLLVFRLTNDNVPKEAEDSARTEFEDMLQFNTASV